MTVVLTCIAAVMVVAGVIFALIPPLASKTKAENIELPGIVRRIQIDVDSGDVSIVGVIRTGATIARRTTGVFATVDAAVELHDGVLTVRARCRSKVFACKVDQAIEVPATAAIDAKTNAGSIDVRGFASSIRLESSSGSLTADKIAGDSVDMRSSSGEIAATALVVRSATLRSGSGAISATFKTPPDAIDASSSSGSVLVSVPRGNYAVDATSASGRVATNGIVNDLSSGRQITARSASGRVQVEGG